MKVEDRWAQQASKWVLEQYLRGGPRGKAHGQVVGNHSLAEPTVRVAVSMRSEPTAGIWFSVTPPKHPPRMGLVPEARGGPPRMGLVPEARGGAKEGGWAPFNCSSRSHRRQCGAHIAWRQSSPAEHSWALRQCW